jgi:hypothetical protein
VTVIDNPKSTAPDDAIAWRPAVPGNAGHPLDVAPLPYWLDRPCPSWCVTLPHADVDHPDDRLHIGASWDVVLTQEPPDVFTDVDGTVLSSEPVRLMAAVYQGYRDRDPYVSMDLGDAKCREVELTFAEAAELAAALGRPGDEYAMITLTLEDSDRRLPEPWPGEPVFWPRQVGVRLESAAEAAELGATQRRVVTVYRDSYRVLTVPEAADMASGIDGLLRDAASGEEPQAAGEAAGRGALGWVRAQAAATEARRIAGLPGTGPGERARHLGIAAFIEEDAAAARQAGMASAARTFLSLGCGPAQVREQAAGLKEEAALLELADAMDRLESAD